VESRTHSKNGAKPKSQTSRDLKLKTMNIRNFIIAALSFALFAGIVSCGKDKDSSSKLPTGLGGNSFNFIYTAAQTGSPYINDQEVIFSFSGSGGMSLDDDPVASDGYELTVASFSRQGNEYIWEGSNGYKYALSLLSDGSINEINVFSLSGNIFLGQFIPIGSDV